MASTTPPRLAALGWALLVVMGAVNLLQDDIATGIGLVIAGCSLAASEVVDQRLPLVGVLRLLGAAGGALALTGIAIEQF